MRRWLTLAASWLVLTTAAVAADPWGPQALRLANWPLLREGSGRLFSSADPTGGNDDRGHFLRMEGSAAVLAEMKGPGCITRIWSANPAGRLQVFLEGEATPRLDEDLAELLHGTSPPFTTPFVGRFNGGWASVVPIPFRQGCRVVLQNPPRLYYQINLQQFPAGTPVETFEPRRLTAALKPIAQEWAHAAEGEGITASMFRFPLPARSKAVLFRSSRPGVIVGGTLRVQPNARATLEQLRLQAFWDGEAQPAVDVPLADLFAGGFGLTRWRSLALEASPEGLTWHLPMPFRQARWRLANQGSQEVQVEGEIRWRPDADLPARAGRLHAAYRAGETKAGVPISLLEANGRGHLIGLVLSLSGDTSLRYLEGDETVWVDGDKTPAWQGTGIEDLFNSAWYFLDGEGSAALSGVPLLWPDKRAVTAYRWFLADCLPFQHSLRFVLEHGATNDAPGTAYRAVVFWYRKEAAPSSSGTRLASDALPPPPAFGWEGAQEAEAAFPHAQRLKDTDSPAPLSGGEAITLSLAAGRTLEWPFQVVKEGIYAVTVRWLAEPGGGPVRLLLDGKSLSIPLSANSPQRWLTTTIMDRRRLAAGEHRLILANQTDTTCALSLDALAPIPAEREKGALEAEELSRLQGDVQVEDLTRPWSAGSALVWRPRSRGDLLEWKLEKPLEGRYGLLGRFETGPQAGLIQILWDRVPVGPALNLYAAQATLSGWLGLGATPTMRGGEHRLALRWESEERSNARVAVDAFLLRPSMGSLEAECLPVLETTAPVAIHQRFGAEPNWFGAAYLQFAASGAGQRLRLGVPVERGGRYRLRLHYVASNLAGRFRVRLGQRLAAEVDPASRVERKQDTDLGSMWLRKGIRPLEIEVVGPATNSQGYAVGLDRLDLEPLGGTLWLGTAFLLAALLALASGIVCLRRRWRRTPSQG